MELYFFICTYLRFLEFDCNDLLFLKINNYTSDMHFNKRLLLFSIFKIAEHSLRAL